jgi:hypothetical protein
MASPTVQARNTGSNSTASTTQTINLPASISAGDLLFVVLAFRAVPGTITPPSGWAYVEDDTGANGALVAAYKTADGSEGATVNFTTANSVRSAHVSYRITGWSGTPERGTAVVATTASPNPPSLSPAGGSADYLFIAAMMENGPITVTGYPTNYSNGQSVSSGGASVCVVGTAERQVTGSSEDPSNFTTNSAGPTIAQTYAISPIAPTFTVDVNISVTTSTSLTKRAAKTIAIAAATTTTRLKSVSKTIAVASHTATSIVKSVGKNSLTMGVNTATSIVKTIGKSIAISLTGAVSLRRDIAKVVMVRCFGLITVIAAFGYLPGIRRVRATLQRIRGASPSLARSRIPATTLYKTRTNDPKLDQ